jgi:O-antigen/teichoic acid export membrane protein
MNTALRCPAGGLLQGGIWAFLDQALISGVSFLTTVLVARSVDAVEFGAFALAYTGLLFARSLQTALVTQPHNVLGTGHRQDYARYTSSTALSQGLLLALTGALTAGGAVVGTLAGWEASALLVSLVPAMVFFQLQEFARRVLYTEGRQRDACGNDLISYGGYMLGGLILWWSGELTGPTALYVLAASSGLATLFGLWQIRSGLVWRIERGVLLENWNFGKWLLGASLGSWTSGQLYLVLVAGLVSVADAGSLRAVQTVMGPTHILLLAIDAGFTPRAASAFADGGESALRLSLRRFFVATAPPMAAYCLLVAAFAAPLLQVVYGDQYAGYGWLLALLSLAYVLEYLSTLAAVGLKARRTSAPIFQAYLLSTLVVLSLGIAMVRAFGLAGAAAGHLVHVLILNGALWARYRRSVKSSA